MPSKQDILANIRKQTVPPVEHPGLAGPWIEYPDPEHQFCEVLAFVGGKAIIVPERSGLEAALRELPSLAESKQVCCEIPGLPFGNYDLNAVTDPHQVEPVDTAILPGEFAVAENGAIWVDGRKVKHRAVYFLTQHLVVVVSRKQMVNNLFDAYQRLSFDDRSYGVFISGPSKTADIEQSLVIGAHGPRSMTAFLVGD